LLSFIPTLIFCIQGQLMKCDPICQHFQMLHHKCYGLANKVCGQCQLHKKTCQDVVVEGEFSPPLFLVAVLRNC